MQVVLLKAAACWPIGTASVQPASRSFSRVTLSVETHVIGCLHLCITLTVSNYSDTIIVLEAFIGLKAASVKNRGEKMRRMVSIQLRQEIICENMRVVYG